MILAIESSCDDSSVSLFCPQKGVLELFTQSQLDLHELYGGIVPALASRQHLKNLPALINKLEGLAHYKEVSQIAVTHGPGLAGCLALGIAMGKALALQLNVPLMGINHLRAHALSPFIPLHKESPKNFLQSLVPHLGLIASGGNSILFLLNEDLSIEIIAQTIDDAAGEALDKGGKLLGLPYPAGPIIEKLAFTGNPQAIKFPIAFPSSEDFRFSFSGLKTSLRYYLEKLSDAELKNDLSDICASYQHAVTQALANKFEHAVQAHKVNSIGLSGGVANNKVLQQKLEKLAQSHEIPLFCALPEHTTDNAAMIAFAAHVDPKHATESTNFDLSFYPSLSLS